MYQVSLLGIQLQIHSTVLRSHGQRMHENIRYTCSYPLCCSLGAFLHPGSIMLHCHLQRSGQERLHPMAPSPSSEKGTSQWRWADCADRMCCSAGRWPTKMQTTLIQHTPHNPTMSFIHSVQHPNTSLSYSFWVWRLLLTKPGKMVCSRKK